VVKSHHRWDIELHTTLKKASLAVALGNPAGLWTWRQMVEGAGRLARAGRLAQHRGLALSASRLGFNLASLSLPMQFHFRTDRCHFGFAYHQQFPRIRAPGSLAKQDGDIAIRL
jgi:hypothetical protein